MPLPSEGEKTGVLKPGADSPGTTRRAPIPTTSESVRTVTGPQGFRACL